MAEMKKPASQEDPLSSITMEEWTIMYQKLRLHTHKRYYWLRRELGEDLDEIAHRAILDTMTGTRRWPPIDKQTEGVRGGISLFSFLCEVVRSNVSHIWEREKRRVSIETSSATQDEEDHGQRIFENLLNEAARKYPNLVRPDDTESQVFYNRIVDKMLEMVAGDQECSEIVKLWSKEPDLKPSEIGEILGLPMPKVRAAQKRLRRLLNGFGEGHSHG